MILEPGALFRTTIPTAFDLFQSEQISNSNLTKTHRRATLNVPVISSESLKRTANYSTALPRLKTNVNILKLRAFGNGKKSWRLRCKVWNSLRKKIDTRANSACLGKKQEHIRVSKHTQTWRSFQVTDTRWRAEGRRHSTPALKFACQVLFELHSQQHPLTMKVRQGSTFSSDIKPTPWHVKPISRSKRGVLQSEKPICLPCGSAP